MTNKAYLEMAAGMGSRLHKFLLANGQAFDTTPTTWDGPRMQQGMCFMNATHMVLEHPDLTYCEGLVTVYGISIDHAWVIDKAGKVIDPTLTKAPGERLGEYWGVPFKTEYLRKSIYKNGVYGLLGWPYAKKTCETLFEGRTKPKIFRAFPNPVDSLAKVA